MNYNITHLLFQAKKYNIYIFSHLIHLNSKNTGFSGLFFTYYAIPISAKQIENGILPINIHID